uniref:Uncharacterized protein n=1 Tax=viral metagenome TaxID=1070528 RepID=A0A6C0HSF4_9ZZZZ
MNINIIYNIWINKERNWKIIIDSQLNDIISSKILERATLYIILVAESDISDESKIFIDSILTKNNIFNYNIDIYYNNHYEYYGIKKIYDLAHTTNDEENTIYLYLHTKGMFNYFGLPNDRRGHERILTRTTVYPWLSVVDTFKNNKNINLMGMFPAIYGLVWFNFFWVRGEYLRKNCIEPEISEDRYYYEKWLVLICNPNESELYNMYEKNFKRYTAEEALKLIHSIEICQDVLGFSELCKD